MAANAGSANPAGLLLEAFWSVADLTALRKIGPYHAEMYCQQGHPLAITELPAPETPW